MTDDHANRAQHTGSTGGKIVAVLLAILSVIFMLNLTAGFIEVPDNLPFIGNVDEAAAMAVLLGSLRYLGIDLLPFLGRIRRRPTDTIEVEKGGKAGG